MAPLPDRLPDPLPLRAHDLLCLLGFRGKGYSKAFVDEMAAIHQGLQDHPDHRVRIGASPGALCRACPHLDGGCTLSGEGHEAQVREQDVEVLRRLGLEEGAVLPYRVILDRVRRRIRGDDLPAICTTCPWLAHGWCAEGLEGLRSA